MRFCIILLLIFAGGGANAQRFNLYTQDIDHFWETYDSLATARDSIAVFQKLYINRASLEMKEFIRVRNFEAGEYVTLIKEYPLFWKSIRPNTERIATRRAEIEHVFQRFQTLYPKFEAPDICFTIGCLRTGGTTLPSLILVGSEMASVDSTTYIREFPIWLQAIMSQTGNITGIVAHEAVHTQQAQNKGLLRGMRTNPLLTRSIREGCADFITFLITGKIGSEYRHDYGLMYEPELWKEFQQDMKKKDISGWLYNGHKSFDRPSDLGYFIGYRICERYYNQSKDKSKAIREMLNIKNYPRFLEKSGYTGF